VEVARRIFPTRRYLRHAQGLGVGGGSADSRALAGVVRALATSASLPLRGDVYTFVTTDDERGIETLAHCHRVPGRNLWVWYWATDDELRLVALTNAPPIVRDS
jgi:hypothetical protein